jgi:hypothetical protein
MNKSVDAEVDILQICAIDAYVDAVRGDAACDCPCNPGVSTRTGRENQFVARVHVSRGAADGLWQFDISVGRRAAESTMLFIPPKRG